MRGPVDADISKQPEERTTLTIGAGPNTGCIFQHCAGQLPSSVWETFISAGQSWFCRLELLRYNYSIVQRFARSIQAWTKELEQGVNTTGFITKRPILWCSNPIQPGDLLQQENGRR